MRSEFEKRDVEKKAKGKKRKATQNRCEFVDSLDLKLTDQI